MKLLSASQIKALLRKDLLVRWRQPWMTLLQLLWPGIIFLLLYLIRLKFGPEQIEDCQFPTRLLPTKNNVLPSFYSYICSLENKCLSTKAYEEYSKWENAPVRPIIDIVQTFITDDRLFNSIVELPEKANFISAVTSLVTSGHLDSIRHNVEKVINLVPEVERMLNGSFDIKRLFSDRRTFVKAGYLMCGHPFPSTESIPLINDILESRDFSDVNDDELQAMPTKYCKRLYLDVTSSNHGKLTWNTIKPIIHGKILYAPENADTSSIMQFTNATFEEMQRLRQLSVSVADIFTKLREDAAFQAAFDSLLKLAQSPIVKSLIGDEFDIDQVQVVMERLRTDPVIYDVVTTIRNILECFSVDRIVPLSNTEELRKTAYALNQQRLFYAAVNFERTNDTDIVYKFHMDTDNTQPTFENHNRFWFPGPSASMLRDLKYHRGFVQIKQALDMGIIKHKKQQLLELGLITEAPPTTTRSPFTIQVVDNDDVTDDDEDDDDDAWFTDTNSAKENKTMNINDPNKKLHTSRFNGLNEEDTTTQTSEHESTTLPGITESDQLNPEDTTEFTTTATTTNADNFDRTERLLADTIPLSRPKRQSLLDLFSSFGNNAKKNTYNVDNLQFYTKQFPYPAYIHDDFKTGLYLAQAVQVSFYLGLVVQIACCVRQRIWMRESRNSMIMRSMGLKKTSELVSWTLFTFVELLIIFFVVLIILYTGGILTYTKWFFVLVYLFIFGACLIAFCNMCASFFSSATIGAVATVLFFFISFCPYIIVLLFDAHLNFMENFLINLSFTTAFAQGWSQIMRMELQQHGLTFVQVLQEGINGECGFAVLMFVLDLCIYTIIGHIYRRYRHDDYSFVVVERKELDNSIGANLTNVTKMYGNDKVAVANISLSFPRNQVTCLLGRNGAGKSTIIKMLTGQVVQTSGRVVLTQTHGNTGSDYDNIGVCAQDNILIPNLTAREHLELYAKIKLKHGYSSEVEKTLKSLNFGKHEFYKAAQLSGGYKRRLCVAIAFIGSPNVVILDEPCNGVDTKARKDIWELIERLRKGRAVLFATHFLDEAEVLSDNIVILKNGKIIAKHSPHTLKEHCTSEFVFSMQCTDENTTTDITTKAMRLLRHHSIVPSDKLYELIINVPYKQAHVEYVIAFVSYLQTLEHNKSISELNIESQNLEQLFRTLDENHSPATLPANGHIIDPVKPVELIKSENIVMSAVDDVRDLPLTRGEAVRELFWKRLVHFSRNYRILLCVIVLPALFELLAMWFVAYRLEDDFDKTLPLTRSLYPQSVQMLSMEQSLPFTSEVYDGLKAQCSNKEFECMEFTNSKKAFYWLLDTLKDYYGRRYGGYSFNQSTSVVWYNNKGYHAMMAWLNDLNTELLRTELNDTEYSITSYNEPWKLGFAELSTSSILRQAGDSCMVFILLIAFSMVVAVAAVYLVNERINGEKLQQKLCGISPSTYWGVAFVWDYLIMLLAIFVCTTIFLSFRMPIFVDRQQLLGIIVLSLFFAFACIPAVHVFEKLFTDSSIAIVGIFCMNLIIPLFTMCLVVLLGVIGDSSVWDEWRYFLNRAFLIFPQHALGDGLLEITKNYMVALVFKRYDIDSYKNPVYSDLLVPHLSALFVLGVFFTLLNIMLEYGLLQRYWSKLCEICNICSNTKRTQMEELHIISIQNTLKPHEKRLSQALKVDNLCKAYRRHQYAVRNVTFAVHRGECFGLLGKNGAGKSTIFKMLSGQLRPTLGSVHYEQHEISYCPQTNTLDPLLTVRECIEFYARLRRIIDIPKLVTDVLKSYQLESYRDVLVKNLSGGNRRKLTVATTCFGRTSTVLMDEPTSDMDPVTRAFVYRAIESLLAARRAIVLTSHSIAEIDELCHRVAVLKDGRIVTCSTPERLKAQYGGFYNVTVFGPTQILSKIEKDVRQLLPEAIDVQFFAHSLKFSIKIETCDPSIPHNIAEHECAIDVPPNSVTSIYENESVVLQQSGKPIGLVQLFTGLHRLAQRHGEHDVRSAISRCRLDAVFERILDENVLRPRLPSPTPSVENATNDIGGVNGSAALSGTAQTGYIHNGYVESEADADVDASGATKALS